MRLLTESDGLRAAAILASSARRGAAAHVCIAREAEAYATNIKGFTLSLVDGRRLAQLLAEHDLGVTPIHTFVMKRVDADVFGEG